MADFSNPRKARDGSVVLVGISDGWRRANRTYPLGLLGQVEMRKCISSQEKQGFGYCFQLDGV